MRSLESRLVRLEQDREEAEEATSPTIRVHITGPEDEQYPREPGTRTLHVRLDGPAWWGEIGEDGVERWVRNA
jgi:hypothetical protein